MVQLINKVIVISNKKTTMRLAKAEWDALDSICQQENIKRNFLIDMINQSKNKNMGLTCCVRLFSVIYFYHSLIKKQYIYNNNENQITPIFDAINSIM
jgi:predicted DNA-binding ribbon-helix-helix protein